MSVLSVVVVERFADLCHVAHRSWVTWRELQRGVHVGSDFSKGISLPAATALSIVMQACQEHAILQIAKLHDPVTIGGNVTLGLEFVTKYGGWEAVVADNLKALKKDLDDRSRPLREHLRNKRIAHNDLAAVVSGGTVIVFEAGQDETYFTKLWEFLDVVYGGVKGAGFARSEEPRRCAEALAEWLCADG